MGYPPVAGNSALAWCWVVSDRFPLQDSIHYSSCITAMLIACSPFGRRLTLAYGLKVAQLNAEPGPSLQIPPSMPILVCWVLIPSCLTLSYSHIPALTPFWDTQTGYWASSRVTTTSVLGYTYPEFNGLDLGNQSAVRQAITQYVNKQYGPSRVRAASSSASPGISLFAQPPAAGGAQTPVAGGTSLADEAVSAVKSTAAGILHPFHSRGGPPHTAEKAQHGKEGQTVVHDWACRIHCKKFELGGSFWVLIFLGQVPDDPSQWRSCPSFVGGHYVFVNSSADQCANCRGQADVVSEGFVHLNKPIASRSDLPSFEPSVVSPYLKENLHWRVQAVRVFPVCLCP
jgi:tyrosinase